MRSEPLKEAQKRYAEKNRILRKTIFFHKESEADLIEYIDSFENFSGKIKELIREDMKKQGL